jgi:hypothetical protein
MSRITLVAEGTNMELHPGQRETAATDETRVSAETLAPLPGEGQMGAVRMFPRERYVAALDGEISMAQFAGEIVSFVEAQMPPSQHGSTASAGDVLQLRAATR